MSSTETPISQADGAVEPASQDTTRNGNSISEDEIALYDRQIRLWGMQAQEKIRKANILLITMRALGNEIAKNLVLAGIGSLTILDDALVTEADLGAQFFLAGDTSTEPSSVIGRNRAEAAAPNVQRLNPRVRVRVDTEAIKFKCPSYFSAFDIIIATDLDPNSLNIINTATRLHNRAFYAAGLHGLYGFIFSDLIEHEYAIEREAGNMPTQVGAESRTRTVLNVATRREGDRVLERVAKRELYSTWYLASDGARLDTSYTTSRRRLRAVNPSLSCLRALWEFPELSGRPYPSHTREDLELFTKLATAKHAALGLPAETLRSEFLRSFLQNVGSEIAPTAALLGGQLAQDVINVLARNQQPIQNMVVFDGESMEASVYALHPEGDLGRALFSSVAAGNGIANGVGNVADA